jgi:hypothetical protein
MGAVGSIGLAISSLERGAMVDSKQQHIVDWQKRLFVGC